MEAKIKVIYFGEEYLCDWFDQSMIKRDELKKIFHVRIYDGGATYSVPLEDIEKVVQN